MRSPVFERMFKGSFCEQETDPVIPDISPAAFRTLLRYCYYECTDIEGDVALMVLYAATKYMLPILVRAARRTVIKKLGSSKIWDACKYSADVGDDELHTGCITYLEENLSEANLLDVMKYAATPEKEDLHGFCEEHFKENLSETNILDVTRYVVSIDDKELHVTCKGFLKEHLSASNIWDVYKYALNEEDEEVREYCRDYFERDVEKVRAALQSEEFPDIQHEVLLDVLRINDKVNEAVGIEYTPGISISEIELFKACIVWAEAECRRQKMESTGTNLKTALKECLSLIRFPTMLHKDLMTVVLPTGILTQAGIVNLGKYMDRDPGSECQVDFPSKERQFVVTPLGTANCTDQSNVLIESEVRVMLSRLWTLTLGGYAVTVKDEKSKRSWSITLNTKPQNHVADDGRPLYYLDIDPQMLGAGTRYTVAANYVTAVTTVTKQPGVEYIKIRKHSPSTELKITRSTNSTSYIHSLTLSLV